MKKIINKFEIEYLQILDENGNCDKKLMPKLSSKDIKDMYKAMVLTRIFDDKLLSLQRQGRVGTIAQVKGQEASNIGSAYALNKEDWIFPSFRETGSLILRGWPPEMIILYFGGDERGSKVPEGVNIFTIAIPVATQLPHAVGFAWGVKLKKDKKVVVTYFGDGSTSEGDFHESLNFAGVFKLPIVFICQNNQYAISVPREKQTAAETLAQKAIAYGFEGIQVDGNDVFAVYRATKEALQKARNGKGPTLIECVTYRMADHTTADDASKYRSKAEVEKWKKKDPIDRLRKYMEKNKMWNKKEEEKLIEGLKKKVEDIVKKAESYSKVNPEDIFKYMYKEMPWNLKEQMEEMKKNMKNE